MDTLSYIANATSTVICWPVEQLLAFVMHPSITHGDWLQVFATIGSVAFAYYFAKKQIILAKEQIDQGAAHKREEDANQKMLARLRFRNIFESILTPPAYHHLGAIDYLKKEAIDFYKEDVAEDMLIGCIMHASQITELTQISTLLPLAAGTYVLNFATTSHRYSVLCGFRERDDFEFSDLEGDIDMISFAHFDMLCNAIKAVEKVQ